MRYELLIAVTVILVAVIPATVISVTGIHVAVVPVAILPVTVIPVTVIIHELSLRVGGNWFLTSSHPLRLYQGET